MLLQRVVVGRDRRDGIRWSGLRQDIVRYIQIQRPRSPHPHEAMRPFALHLAI
jgi:hypothetical protein